MSRRLSSGLASGLVYLATACSGDIGAGPDLGAAGAPLGVAFGAGAGSVPSGGAAPIGVGTGGAGPGSVPNGMGGAGSVVLAPGTSMAGTGAVVDANGNVISEPYTTPTPDATPVPARAWLLTHEQYAKSVAEVLGVTPDVSAFSPLIDAGQFANFSNASFVRVDLAEDYMDAAAAAVASLSNDQLAALVPGVTLDASGRDAFLSGMIRRVFRRPATAADLARYQPLFDAASDAADASRSFRATLEALLTSPYFLYRTEIGPLDAAVGTEPAATFQPTPHEQATFLSYSLLDAPPPPALSAAADAGDLTPSLAAHVATLLADPRAEAQWAHFLGEWLEVDAFDQVEKFEDTFPGFEQIREGMLTETDAFFEAAGNLGTGSLTALLTAPVPDVDSGLSAFYQSDATAPPTASRLGLLALGAVLSQHAKPQLTSPTLRGLFVRGRMLCQKIELPPDLNPPPLTETEERERPTTTRELYELHASEPLCASCHSLMDPIGFNLEGFDGAGRVRTLENGVTLNTTGVLIGSDVDRTITSAAELAQALSESTWVRECLATQAYRFYYGRVESSRGIQPIAASRVAAGDNGALGALVLALMEAAPGTVRSRE